MTVKPASRNRGRRRERKHAADQQPAFSTISSRCPALWTTSRCCQSSARREAQTFARSQIERMMAGMNVVAREEFEAVKEIGRRARDEASSPPRGVAALEAKLNEPRP